MTEEKKRDLCRAATDAMRYAYVPYSGYSVGAALLTKDGTVYTGCNIENASYTPTVCAERTAVFKAVSEGKRTFAAIAVAGGREGAVDGSSLPCGVCRQVLSEFCPPDFSVLIVEKEGKYREYRLDELLPHAFDLCNLHKK